MVLFNLPFVFEKKGLWTLSVMGRNVKSFATNMIDYKNELANFVSIKDFTLTIKFNRKIDFMIISKSFKKYIAVRSLDVTRIIY